MPASLQERLLQGVQNMLSKRGQGKLSPVESKCGYAYTTEDSKILLFIPSIADGEIEKIKNEQVKYLYFLFESYGISHAIVPYSSFAPQAYEIIRSHTFYRVELFKFKHLLFDPTAHKKTPPHNRVPLENIKVELPRIKVKDLPHILDTDPIVRFYDWSIGDVVRIDRPDGAYYRVVTQE
jgi:DNA-directed RNA polymerase subunit H (RpoH/RPB5)